MKTLSITEKKLVELISYKTQSSECLYNSETKKRDIVNPDYVNKVRIRIKQELRKRGLNSNYDLLKVLKAEKRYLKKVIKKEEKHALKERQQASRLRSLETKTIQTIYERKKVITPLTDSELKEYVTFQEFGKDTSTERKLIKQLWLNNGFRQCYNYKTGVHNNNYIVNNAEKLALYYNSTDDWEVYSKKTKYPAKHYTFYLDLPKHYSFTNIGSLLTVFKGKKIDRKGISVIWFEQSTGMAVKQVEGFLVRGFHVQKTQKIRTLNEAIEYVSKRRSEVARNIKNKRFYGRLTENQIKEELSKIWITKSDSLNAGNCEPGTQNFKERYEKKNGYGNIGAIRGDELLNQANGDIYYVKKIFANKFGMQL